jgi:hypothetical protein
VPSQYYKGNEKVLDPRLSELFRQKPKNSIRFGETKGLLKFCFSFSVFVCVCERERERERQLVANMLCMKIKILIDILHQTQITSKLRFILLLEYFIT